MLEAIIGFLNMASDLLKKKKKIEKGQIGKAIDTWSYFSLLLLQLFGIPWMENPLFTHFLVTNIWIDLLFCYFKQ